MTASAQSSSIATAIAAKAFCALCLPGIGRDDAFDAAIFRPTLAYDHVEHRAAVARAKVDTADIGLQRKPVGDDLAIAHLADQCLYFGMVDAQDCRTVERHVLDEFEEGALDRLEVTVMFEMLGIDIGNHGDRAIEPQKAAVALVRLHDHPIAIAQPRVGAILLDNAAVDHGGIDAACVEQGRDHAGRGGLAMRSRDRDSAFQPHQFGQHLGPSDDGDSVFERGGDFGVVALHRRGCHDHSGITQIAGIVPDRNGDAFCAQSLHACAVGYVRPLHAVSQIVHHFRDTGHADTADAHEMDRADLHADALHAMPRPTGEPCEAGAAA